MLRSPALTSLTLPRPAQPPDRGGGGWTVGPWLIHGLRVFGPECRSSVFTGLSASWCNSKLPTGSPSLSSSSGRGDVVFASSSAPLQKAVRSSTLSLSPPLPTPTFVVLPGTISIPPLLTRNLCKMPARERLPVRFANHRPLTLTGRAGQARNARSWMSRRPEKRSPFVRGAKTSKRAHATEPFPPSRPVPFLQDDDISLVLASAIAICRIFSGLGVLPAPACGLTP